MNKTYPGTSEGILESTGKVLTKKNIPAGRQKLNLKNSKVFFDFDNTITLFDVLDDIVKRFSLNKEWRKLEQDWRRGKIGSKECLAGQLALVRISKDDFLKYLSTIKIDAYFAKILELLGVMGTEVAIVSDSFSFVINYILENNGIRGIKIYSNSLKFNKDRFVLEFPYVNKLCPKCANCKKERILNHGINEGAFIYIGDGLSDFCPAKSADLVFAKGSLLEHCRKNKIKHIEFDTLAVVYNRLKELA